MKQLPYKFIYPTTLIYLVVFIEVCWKETSRFVFIYPRTKLYFNVIETPFVMK